MIYQRLKSPKEKTTKKKHLNHVRKSEKELIESKIDVCRAI
jgi:hypothetical protein